MRYHSPFTWRETEARGQSAAPRPQHKTTARCPKKRCCCTRQHLPRSPPLQKQAGASSGPWEDGSSREGGHRERGLGNHWRSAAASPIPAEDERFLQPLPRAAGRDRAGGEQSVTSQPPGVKQDSGVSPGEETLGRGGPCNATQSPALTDLTTEKPMSSKPKHCSLPHVSQ